MILKARQEHVLTDAVGPGAMLLQLPEPLLHRIFQIGIGFDVLRIVQWSKHCESVTDVVYSEAALLQTMHCLALSHMVDSMPLEMLQVVQRGTDSKEFIHALDSIVRPIHVVWWDLAGRAGAIVEVEDAAALVKWLSSYPWTHAIHTLRLGFTCSSQLKGVLGVAVPACKIIDMSI